MTLVDQSTVTPHVPETEICAGASFAIETEPPDLLPPQVVQGWQ